MGKKKATGRKKGRSPSNSPVSKEQDPIDLFKLQLKYEPELLYLIKPEKVHKLSCLLDAIAVEAYEELFTIACEYNDAEAMHTLVRKDVIKFQRMTISQAIKILHPVFYSATDGKQDELAVQIEKQGLDCVINYVSKMSRINLQRLLVSKSFSVSYLQHVRVADLFVQLMKHHKLGVYLKRNENIRTKLFVHSCETNSRAILELCVNDRIFPASDSLPLAQGLHSPLALYGLLFSEYSAQVTALLLESLTWDAIDQLNTGVLLEIWAFGLRYEATEILELIHRKLDEIIISPFIATQVCDEVFAILLSEKPELFHETDTVDAHMMIIERHLFSLTSPEAITPALLYKNFYHQLLELDDCLVDNALLINNEIESKQHFFLQADLVKSISAKNFSPRLLQLFIFNDCVEGLQALHQQADVLSDKFFVEALQQDSQPFFEQDECNPLLYALKRSATNCAALIYTTIIDKKLALPDVSAYYKDLLMHLLDYPEIENTTIQHLLIQYPGMGCSPATLIQLLDRCIGEVGNVVDMMFLTHVAPLLLPYIYNELFLLMSDPMQIGLSGVRMEALAPVFHQLACSTSDQELSASLVCAAEKLKKSAALVRLEEEIILGECQQTQALQELLTREEKGPELSLDIMARVLTLNKQGYAVMCRELDTKICIRDCNIFSDKAGCGEIVSEATPLELMVYYEYYDAFVTALRVCPGLLFKAQGQYGSINILTLLADRGEKAIIRCYLNYLGVQERTLNIKTPLVISRLLGDKLSPFYMMVENDIKLDLKSVVDLAIKELRCRPDTYSETMRNQVACFLSMLLVSIKGVPISKTQRAQLELITNLWIGGNFLERTLRDDSGHCLSLAIDLEKIPVAVEARAMADILMFDPAAQSYRSLDAYFQKDGNGFSTYFDKGYLYQCLPSDVLLTQYYQAASCFYKKKAKEYLVLLAVAAEGEYVTKQKIAIFFEALRSYVITFEDEPSDDAQRLCYFVALKNYETYGLDSCLSYDELAPYLNFERFNDIQPEDVEDRKTQQLAHAKLMLLKERILIGKSLSRHPVGDIITNKKQLTREQRVFFCKEVEESKEYQEALVSNDFNALVTQKSFFAAALNLQYNKSKLKLSLGVTDALALLMYSDCLPISKRVLEKELLHSVRKHLGGMVLNKEILRDACELGLEKLAAEMLSKKSWDDLESTKEIAIILHFMAINKFTKATFKRCVDKLVVEPKHKLEHVFNTTFSPTQIDSLGHLYDFFGAEQCAKFLTQQEGLPRAITTDQQLSGTIKLLVMIRYMAFSDAAVSAQLKRKLLTIDGITLSEVRKCCYDLLSYVRNTMPDEIIFGLAIHEKSFLELIGAHHVNWLYQLAAIYKSSILLGIVLQYSLKNNIPLDFLTAHPWCDGFKPSSIFERLYDKGVEHNGSLGNVVLMFQDLLNYMRKTHSEENFQKFLQSDIFISGCEMVFLAFDSVNDEQTKKEIYYALSSLPYENIISLFEQVPGRLLTVMATDFPKKLQLREIAKKIEAVKQQGKYASLNDYIGAIINDAIDAVSRGESMVTDTDFNSPLVMAKSKLKKVIAQIAAIKESLKDIAGLHFLSPDPTPANTDLVLQDLQRIQEQIVGMIDYQEQMLAPLQALITDMRTIRLESCIVDETLCPETLKKVQELLAKRAQQKIELLQINVKYTDLEPCYIHKLVSDIFVELDSLFNVLGNELFVLDYQYKQSCEVKSSPALFSHAAGATKIETPPPLLLLAHVNLVPMAGHLDVFRVEYRAPSPYATSIQSSSPATLYVRQPGVEQGRCAISFGSNGAWTLIQQQKVFTTCCVAPDVATELSMAYDGNVRVSMFFGPMQALQPLSNSL